MKNLKERYKKGDKIKVIVSATPEDISHWSGEPLERFRLIENKVITMVVDRYTEKGLGLIVPELDNWGTFMLTDSGERYSNHGRSHNYDIKEANPLKEIIKEVKRNEKVK